MIEKIIEQWVYARSAELLVKSKTTNVQILLALLEIYSHSQLFNCCLPPRMRYAPVISNYIGLPSIDSQWYRISAEISTNRIQILLSLFFFHASLPLVLIDPLQRYQAKVCRLLIHYFANHPLSLLHFLVLRLPCYSFWTHWMLLNLSYLFNFLKH